MQPISLGLYVGDASTPNHLATAKQRLAEEVDGKRPSSTPRQLLQCPVCGTDLPARAYQVLDDPPALEIRCPSGSCPTGGAPLPVSTVDEVLYQAPPSLLIGTIDKFAQLPRKQEIRALFGLDGGLRPGLIIQDELHLISGPLGSMAGLYEAAVDLICTVDDVPSEDCRLDGHDRSCAAAGPGVVRPGRVAVPAARLRCGGFLLRGAGQ